MAKNSYVNSPPEPCSYTVSVPDNYGAFLLVREKGWGLYADDGEIQPAVLKYLKTATFKQDGKEYTYHWYQEQHTMRDWFFEVASQSWRSVYYRNAGARRDVPFGTALFAPLHLATHSFASLIRDRASEA